MKKIIRVTLPPPHANSTKVISKLQLNQAEHKLGCAEFSRCEDILSNCKYILYGKLDADGRLEGLSELVIHWTEGDSLEFRPEEVGEEDSPDTFCCSASVTSGLIWYKSCS